jgi:hypothetical protein
MSQEEISLADRKICAKSVIRIPLCLDEYVNIGNILGGGERGPSWRFRSEWGTKSKANRRTNLVPKC